MFVSFAAPGDGALPEWIDYETSLREEGTSPGIVGNLRVGNSRVDPEEIGFEAVVYQTLLYNGRGEDLLGVWSASYPIAHVPLQQPSTEEWQQANAYDTLYAKGSYVTSQPNTADDPPRGLQDLLLTMTSTAPSDLAMFPDDKARPNVKFATSRLLLTLPPVVSWGKTK
jgi:hypothetical protein